MMIKAKLKRAVITEAEYRSVLNSEAFTPEEREMIDCQRKQLTARGIVKEPMRTRLACEFASVLLASRLTKEPQ